jgi:two-component system, OmpR family, response regulator QseB
MNILLVEDDLDLANGIRLALQDNGMKVNWVRRIDYAVHALETDECDLIVLDLGLPDGDGLDFLASIRRKKNTKPVLILTARDSLSDRLAGLDGGADDYLVKPFELAELLSRVRALARRSFGLLDEAIELRGIRIFEASMKVTFNEESILLSRTEFVILAKLMKAPDRVITRRILEDALQSIGRAGGGMAESNVLDVHISNLRRKIGEGIVRTVRGVGYVIDRQ